MKAPTTRIDATRVWVWAPLALFVVGCWAFIIYILWRSV